MHFFHSRNDQVSVFARFISIIVVLTLVFELPYAHLAIAQDNTNGTFPYSEAQLDKLAYDFTVISTLAGFAGIVLAIAPPAAAVFFLISDVAGGIALSITIAKDIVYRDPNSAALKIINVKKIIIDFISNYVKIFRGLIPKEKDYLSDQIETMLDELSSDANDNTQLAEPTSEKPPLDRIFVPISGEWQYTWSYSVGICPDGSQVKSESFNAPFKEGVVISTAFDDASFTFWFESGANVVSPMVFSRIKDGIYQATTHTTESQPVQGTFRYEATVLSQNKIDLVEFNPFPLIGGSDPNNPLVCPRQRPGTLELIKAD